jgi:ubiquinone/menaquinone biosynthesis C-methylase UbiE
MASTIHNKFAIASVEQWLELLQRSVREPFIEGVEFPRFPHSSIQNGYNGAADEEGMLRAHGFWRYAEGYCKAIGNPLGAHSTCLDIGCGWGRITRTFARDLPPDRIHGVDIDPNAIVLCNYLGVPGKFTLTKPGAPLPYQDGSFSVVTASSVFTHLPQNTATALVGEIARVAAPGCIFVLTVEDGSFLDTLATPGIENNDNGRWRLLARYAGQVEALRARFTAGEYVYLVTNEEAYRSSDVYGDALIPRAFIEAQWSRDFRMMAYEPACAPVYQAVVVLMRR